MNRNNTPSEETDRECPGDGLATTSVVLAIVMEAPCGIESGLIYGVLSESCIYTVLLARLICLAIIFLPLAIYINRYGLHAMKFLRGRIAIILIVTSIFLAHNLLIFGGKSLGW